MAGLTQEQAAEVLGISRQTISNWENDKFYPDIISVLRMSDLYNVSLDYLLKGEQMMSYVDYLSESTNVVKSKTKLSKLLLILTYLIIWAFAIIFFWFFNADEDAMGYSLMFLWVILPVTTIIVSFLIGKNDYWGKYKWSGSITFGIMYMLAEYATFSMANNVTFNKVNVPEFGMIITGAILSLIGMAIGYGIHENRKAKSE